MDFDFLDRVGHFDDKRRRQAVFSVDFQPRLKVLAVGGIDGAITLWLKKDCDAAEEAGRFELLSTFSRHDGAVLCVRWAPEPAQSPASLARFASCSDDAFIFVWQQESPGSPNYNVLKRINGHTSDVTQVEWSPCARFLASCSIDGTICIWSSDDSFSLASRLAEMHTPVKGISWHPQHGILQLLAVGQSKALVFSHSCGWAMEQDISSCLGTENLSTDSLFFRPSWSPDGKLIALPNACNGLLPVASIVDSDAFDANPPISLVGHLSSTIISKFCPCFISGPDATAEDCSSALQLIAVASQDGWLSLWSSKREHPLMIVSEIFDQSFMDLAWIVDDDHSTIIACGYDGNVVEISLDPSIFGRPVMPKASPQGSSESDKISNRSAVPDILADRSQQRIQSQLMPRRRIAPKLLQEPGSMGTVKPHSGLQKISVEIAVASDKGQPVFESCQSRAKVARISASVLIEINDRKLRSLDSSKKHVFWEEDLGDCRQGLLSAGADFCAVLLNCSGIAVFSSKTGRRLLPNISLSQPAAFFRIASNFLVVVSTAGSYLVFDIAKKDLAYKGYISYSPASETLGMIEDVILGQDYIQAHLKDSHILSVSLQSSQTYSSGARPPLEITQTGADSVLSSISQIHFDPSDMGEIVNSALLGRNKELSDSAIPNYIISLIKLRKWLHLQEFIGELETFWSHLLHPELAATINEALALGGAATSKMGLRKIKS